MSSRFSVTKGTAVALLTLTFAGVAQATPSDCPGSSYGGQSFSYCITQTPQSSSSSTVIYYFHGNGGSAQSWASETHQAIEQLWKRDHVAPPTIVTVSFGASWFLTETSSFFAGSIQDAFVKGVLPQVEGQIGTKVTKRILLGESMGGFNSAIASVKIPSYFSRIAILCPALYPFSPYASSAVKAAYFASHQPSMNQDLFARWIGKQQKYFRSESEWLAHSPLDLSASYSKATPPLFILGDEADEFGFYDGAKALKQSAQGRGANVKWFSTPKGSHCAHTGPSLEALARFLTNR